MRQETDYKLPSNSQWMHKSGESVASLDLGSKDLEDENKVLPAKIRQVRGG
jgi:hypothetical protein